MTFLMLFVINMKMLMMNKDGGLFTSGETCSWYPGVSWKPQVWLVSFRCRSLYT